MPLKKKFEIYHICEQIEKVDGRRYNHNHKKEKPDIEGYCIKETTAGLFRTWQINEIHFQFVIAVNKLQVVSFTQLVKLTGLCEANCIEYLNECVLFGLLCENIPQNNNGSEVFDKLYFVDTGGIFALEEAGIPYRHLPYTSGIDQRINICRRNIFVVEQGYKEPPRGLIFLEDIIGGPLPKGEGIVLYDSSIALLLGVTQEVKEYLIKLLDNGLKVYDLDSKEYGIDKLG